MRTVFIIWLSFWTIIAAALRVYTWRDGGFWLPSQAWTGHYPVWLLALRSLALIIAGVSLLAARWQKW